MINPNKMNVEKPEVLENSQKIGGSVVKHYEELFVKSIVWIFRSQNVLDFLEDTGITKIGKLKNYTLRKLKHEMYYYFYWKYGEEFREITKKTLRTIVVRMKKLGFEWKNPDEKATYLGDLKWSGGSPISIKTKVENAKRGLEESNTTSLIDRMLYAGNKVQLAKNKPSPQLTLDDWERMVQTRYRQIRDNPILTTEQKEEEYYKLGLGIDNCEYLHRSKRSWLHDCLYEMKMSDIGVPPEKWYQW